MILYLDTSALVKLIISEPESEAVDALVAATEYVVTSVIAYAECRSAIPRAARSSRHRLRGMDAIHLASALALTDEELSVALATFDRPLAAAARTEGLRTPVGV